VALLGLPNPGPGDSGCKKPDILVTSSWEVTGLSPEHAAGAGVGSGTSLKGKMMSMKGPWGPAGSAEKN
jgi:hypothetical protein